MTYIQILITEIFRHTSSSSFLKLGHCGSNDDSPTKKLKKDKRKRLSKAGKELLKTCHPPAATLADLYEEILLYKCVNETCVINKNAGGCFRAQFQGNENQMKMLLSLYREKARTKNEEELKKFAIELFKD